VEKEREGKEKCGRWYGKGGGVTKTYKNYNYAEKNVGGGNQRRTWKERKGTGGMTAGGGGLTFLGSTRARGGTSDWEKGMKEREGGGHLINKGKL